MDAFQPLAEGNRRPHTAKNRHFALGIAANSDMLKDGEQNAKLAARAVLVFGLNRRNLAIRDEPSAKL
jgi:hypothetical protein